MLGLSWSHNVGSTGCKGQSIGQLSFFKGLLELDNTPRKDVCPAFDRSLDTSGCFF